MARVTENKMASFDLAIDKTLEREGRDEYSDNPNDAGGPTKYGISLRFYLDAVDGEATAEVIKNLTEDNAKAIYKKHFWLKASCDKIQNQPIANKIFDLAVNMGVKQAIKIAQRAVYAQFGYDCMDDDGVIGVVSLSKINSPQLDRMAYLCSIKCEAAGIYRILIGKGNNAVFEKGWLRRAYD